MKEILANESVIKSVAALIMISLLEFLEVRGNVVFKAPLQSVFLPV